MVVYNLEKSFRGWSVGGGINYLRVVIVFRHCWSDLARSFSSVVGTECILSVGAADSVDKVLFMAAAAANYEMAAIVDFLLWLRE